MKKTITHLFTIPGDTMSKNYTYCLRSKGSPERVSGTIISGIKFFTGLVCLVLFSISSKATIVAPVISSITPSHAAPGTTVTISGSYFNSTAGNNIVYFGGARATVISGSSSSLTVTVPIGATYAPVSVTNSTYHTTGYSNLPFTPTYNNSSYIDTIVNFDTTQIYIESGSSSAVALGDLDGDGKPDMVVTNYNSGTMLVYLNTATSGIINTSSFASPISITADTGANYIAIGDLDGDGKPDIAVANNADTFIYVYLNTSTVGSISFASPLLIRTGGVYTYGVAIGDIDGNGKPEIVAMGQYGAALVFANTSSIGSLSFSTSAYYDMSGTGFGGSIGEDNIVIGDIDGDGKPDIATASYDDNQVVVLHNTSTVGSFSFDAKQTFAVGNAPTSIAIGDLNGDGKPELVTTDQGSGYGVPGTVSVLQNTSSSGSISFATALPFQTDEDPSAVAIASMTGNTLPDLVVTSFGSYYLSVLRNTTTGGTLNFDTISHPFYSGYQADGIAVADIDGDGKPDVAASDYTSFFSGDPGMVVVMRNDPLAPVTGTLSVCTSDPFGSDTIPVVTPYGSWSSSNTGVAEVFTNTIDFSAAVEGVSAGTATLTYSVFGGYVTTTVTVNASAPSPGAITGPSSVNVGSNITLSDATSGGSWSASNGNAIVTGGVVTGESAGSVTISYGVTNGCGTAYATAPVTVNSVSGSSSLSVCAGGTTTLTPPGSGGTWSSGNLAVASIGSTSGIVTASSVYTGTATITYTVGTAHTTMIVTVNPNPTTILGASNECEGATITLSDATSGGTWSGTGYVSVATVGTNSGTVTGGETAGTGTITYTLPTGCFVTYPNTVHANPSAIFGTGMVCVGSTTMLSDTTSGALSYASSNTLVATVLNSGQVTGIAAGTATITYKITSGCTTTTVVTVNSLPGAITGSAHVCAGASITLSDPAGTGTWSSSNTAIATVVSGSGVVTGVASGTSTIVYMAGSTGCKATATVTVNPILAISGSANVCTGSLTTLNDGTAGGTWSSIATSVATIGSGGVVTGLEAGTTTISYTIAATGCASGVVVTVNPVPTILGAPASICIGGVTTLSDATTGGTWSSSNTAHGSIGVTSGIITGIAAGTTTITYVAPVAGCISTAVITVNPTTSILGATSVCQGSTVSLSDVTGGGTWSSSNTVAATIGTTGIVTGVEAGTTTISYIIASTGCATAAVLTINPAPQAISGTNTVCIGMSTTLTDITGGGSWSSGNTAVATVGSGTGIVMGLAGGTALIHYIGSNGCSTTATVSVSASVGAITGASSVCVGLTTSLSDATSGGTWSSSNMAVGSVGTSGIVEGLAPGTTNIVYTSASGCTRTVTLSVISAPSINPPSSWSLCASSVATLTGTPSGGTWSLSSSLVAAIGGSTGIVTASGTYTGTTTVSYSVGGCAATNVLTVNANPKPVQGLASECVGITITLSDATAGGVWTASNSNVTVTGSTVTGAIAGSSTITYTLPATGCYITYPNTIHTNPLAITGTFNICAGAMTTLTDPTSGALSWASSNTTVATITNSGIITAVAGGTTTITYKITSGCVATQVFTVTAYPVVSAISGPSTITLGSPEFLSEATPGGIWSSSNSAVISLSGTTGSPVLATAAGASGSAVISYAVTNGPGCTTTATLNIAAIIISPHGGNTTGIDPIGTQTEGTVQLYPNPTNGFINIKTDAAGIFYLYSIDGKTLGEYKVVEGITNLALPNDLATGIYMGMYKGDDGTNAVFKIAKN